MENQQLRQVAYKVWISDILKNDFNTGSGEWDPNYVVIGKNNVSRVNIIANIITNYTNEEGDYVSITIDDGSGSIQIKAWKEDVKSLKELSVGDTLLIIGRVKEYNTEKYLTAEIVKKLTNPEWLVYRKKELGKGYENPVNSDQVLKQEKDLNGEEIISQHTEEVVGDLSETEGTRQKILNIISDLATEDGADKLEIIKQSSLDEQTADGIIQSLLMEGEIFEIKPGKLKILG